MNAKTQTIVSKTDQENAALDGETVDRLNVLAKQWGLKISIGLPTYHAVWTGTVHCKMKVYERVINLVVNNIDRRVAQVVVSTKVDAETNEVTARQFLGVDLDWLNRFSVQISSANFDVFVNRLPEILKPALEMCKPHREQRVYRVRLNGFDRGFREESDLLALLEQFEISGIDPDLSAELVTADQTEAAFYQVIDGLEFSPGNIRAFIETMAHIDDWEEDHKALLWHAMNDRWMRTAKECIEDIEHSIRNGIHRCHKCEKSQFLAEHFAELYCDDSTFAEFADFIDFDRYAQAMESCGSDYGTEFEYCGETWTLETRG